MGSSYCHRRCEANTAGKGMRAKREGPGTEGERKSKWPLPYVVGDER